jgi:predicted membrane-bound spermidine synthase
MPVPYKRSYLGLALAAVFFVSGATSLVFQVAWQRLLTLYYGVGPVSVALIVSVYMLGLGAGSLLGGYLAERVRRHVRVYLAVEVGLGLFGLLSLPFLEYLGRQTAGNSHWVSLVCIFLFLCAPTLCMGMTLPLLVKIFTRHGRQFVEAVGFLYFVNTLGAAAGALVGSYVLISFFGLDRTIYLAAGVDFLLAGVVLLALRRQPAETGIARSADQPRQPELLPGALGRAAYAVVLLTGFVAVGYEIAWFRFLEVLLKNSPYVFPSMLAVYLLGIAVGSRFMSRYLKKRPGADTRGLFFGLQFLIAAYVVVSFAAFYFLTRHTRFGALPQLSFATELHPWWGLGAIGTKKQTLFVAVDIFFWPVLFVLVPTLLMGASFPLIARLALSQRDREGETVGQVYFWNTTGNVLGGALTGFVLLPALGTERTLLALSLVGVLLLLATRRLGRRPLWGRLAFCGLLVTAMIAIFPGRGRLYAAIHPPRLGARQVFTEGLDGVVMTYQSGEAVNTYINGLIHGGRPGYGFYRETVEALAFAPRAENILVIGFGTGSITEAVLKAPGVHKVTLVEINRTLLTNLSQMEVFKGILADPRVRLVLDDGRRFLLQPGESYDLVLIDPLYPTTAFSNNLYSEEFYQLVGSRLNPGGIFLVWSCEHRVMPRTVAAAFRHMRWYSFFFLGSNAPMVERPGAREAILAAFSPADRKGTLEFGAEFLGGEDRVAEATQGYPVNRDWRPVCEYFLGLQARKRLGGLN